MSGATTLDVRVVAGGAAPLHSADRVSVDVFIALVALCFALLWYGAPVVRVLWAQWRPQAWRARACLAGARQQ